MEHVPFSELVELWFGKKIFNKVKKGVSGAARGIAKGVKKAATATMRATSAAVRWKIKAVKKAASWTKNTSKSAANFARKSVVKTVRWTSRMGRTIVRYGGKLVKATLQFWNQMVTKAVNLKNWLANIASRFSGYFALATKALESPMGKMMTRKFKGMFGKRFRGVLKPMGFTWADFHLVIRMTNKNFWIGQFNFFKFMFSDRLIKAIKGPSAGGAHTLLWA